MTGDIRHKAIATMTKMSQSITGAWSDGMTQADIDFYKGVGRNLKEVGLQNAATPLATMGLSAAEGMNDIAMLVAGGLPGIVDRISGRTHYGRDVVSALRLNQLNRFLSHAQREVMRRYAERNNIDVNNPSIDEKMALFAVGDLQWAAGQLIGFGGVSKALKALRYLSKAKRLQTASKIPTVSSAIEKTVTKVPPSKIKKVINTAVGAGLAGATGLRHFEKTERLKQDVENGKNVILPFSEYIRRAGPIGPVQQDTPDSIKAVTQVNVDHPRRMYGSRRRQLRRTNRDISRIIRPINTPSQNTTSVDNDTNSIFSRLKESIKSVGRDIRRRPLNYAVPGLAGLTGFLLVNTILKNRQRKNKEKKDKQKTV